MNRSKILKQNAALLITDYEDILENKQLFKLNKSIGHACGYHYSIKFFDKSNKIYDDIPFNQECEEFLKNNVSIQNRMERYIELLETEPTHFIYNLKLAMNKDPYSAIETLGSKGLNIYALDRLNFDKTSITFNYSHETPIVELTDRSKWPKEQKVNEKECLRIMNSILNDVKTNFNVVYTKPDEKMQGFGGGRITHEFQSIIRLSNDAELLKIKELIVSQNGTITEITEPSNNYIQIVSEESSISEIEKLIGEIDFIEAVFEYPNDE